MKRWFGGLFLTLIACTAQAQAIYRCGPGGTEYSQTPCLGGKLLESSDSRTASQRAEAERVAARERKRAADLERERVEQEANRKPALATGINGRPLPSAATTPPAGKSPKANRKSTSGSPKKSRTVDFVAVVPDSKKSPRK